MSLQDQPYPKCKTLDDFYYPAQQINKIIPDDEDDEENDNQNDKKDTTEDKKEDIKDKKNNKKNGNGLLDKVPSRRSYYELEPRFNNVIFPWRAYTWTYPIQPNTETYFRDNTRSLSPNPVYIPNLNLREGTSGVKVPKLEKFKNISKNKKGKDIDPVMMIIVVILILFLCKMSKII
jgi:hypothetical protein